MELLTTTVARVLFALPFFVFGLGHFMNAEEMAAMVPAWMPAKMMLNYLTGLALIAASISIVWGKMAKLACLLLALMLFIFIMTMHIPNMMGEDPMMKQLGMISTFKDLGLMGASLAFAGIFAKEV